MGRSDTAFYQLQKKLHKIKAFSSNILSARKTRMCSLSKNRNCTILKTDLWNEGVEYDRDLITEVSKIHMKKKLFAMDVSPKICDLGKKRLNDKTEVVCSSVMKPPFKISPSTLYLNIDDRSSSYRTNEVSN